MYFIGVDSGGTKTSFVLCDESGRILARRLSGKGTFISVGREKIAATLREGVAALCAAAGIRPTQIAFAALGFPGYGESAGSAEVLDALCADVLGAGKVFCECDCYLGWAGSLAMEPGINIISGTGANCYGVDSQGRAARCSGWGAYCDEGSCRWIGSRLLQEFTRQADGRAPRTPLYAMLRKALQITNDLHFIGPLNHRYGCSDAETAQLQVLLKDIYDAGDPIAARIYQEAAEELWLAISTVGRKLDFLGHSHRVSYSGGLFRSGERILAPLRGLVEAGGGALAAPRFEPDQGALLIAMRQVLPGLDFTHFKFTE